MMCIDLHKFNEQVFCNFMTAKRIPNLQSFKNCFWEHIKTDIFPRFVSGKVCAEIDYSIGVTNCRFCVCREYLFYTCNWVYK